METESSLRPNYNPFSEMIASAFLDALSQVSEKELASGSNLARCVFMCVITTQLQQSHPSFTVYGSNWPGVEVAKQVDVKL